MFASPSNRSPDCGNSSTASSAYMSCEPTGSSAARPRLRNNICLSISASMAIRVPARTRTRQTRVVHEMCLSTAPCRGAAYGDGVDRSSRSAGSVQRAVRLEFFTIGWNAVEFVLSVTLGFVAGSLALGAFGLDSLIEIFAAVVVIWQLGGRSETRTRRAMALVAVAFLALSVFLLAGAARSLLTSAKPDSSPFGIVY